MRHRRKTQNLSRFSSYFQATIHSIARSVIINQRIVTTKVRAKLVKRVVDRLITLGKETDSLAARRRANSYLNDHGLVKRLFTDIAPMFSEKKGGYTRIIPYKRRRGDNAELVVLELSVIKEIPRPVKEKKEKKEKEKPVEPKRAVEEKPKAEVKEEKPKVVEHKERKEKETKKPSKKMLGGFEKFFKRKRDSL